MTSAEMQCILEKMLPRETTPLDPPTPQDWRVLEAKFECAFGEDFKIFIALMSQYRFPGEILNVSSGRTNGNDTIDLAFDMEVGYSRWNPQMIPFYAIGNGDYFCLSRDQCPTSPVYYFYSERGTAEIYSSSFDVWIRHLPQFLA